MSLTLSGGLTGYLVQQLQYDDAMDQLAKQALIIRPQIQAWDRSRCVGLRCTPATPSELASAIDANRAELNLGDSRLILLDRGRPASRVIYDSDGSLDGVAVPLGREALVSGVRVREGRPTLDGQTYLAAGAASTARNVSLIIVGRPQARVAAQATGQLVTPILQAAGAGLLLAIVVTLLLGRAFSRPLKELRRAAEDIAGGNYARRVRTTGRDEIGVVAQAFNGMAEAVERTRHQQRTFLANVSHELKTPLTSLIGFSQALMDGSLRTDEEKTRAATILHEEAQRVLRMSQELLDLARVEAGQLALNPHPVDLGVQLQQEIEIVRKRAEGRRLTLRLAVPSALPPVRADPDRLHQILENLLDNAVKYAPEGTTVWISAEPGVGGRITTAVRNRVGMRVPDPERMFDRFYRGDPSRSSAGGVGLGLAISRELALAQNGDLRAELHADGTLSLQLDLPAVTQPPAGVQTPTRGPIRLDPRPQPRG
ncbi:MAG TPA: HAMP domain-containing sensor histidine kinase [Candidatus Dormibacteraeota bacterium]|nr:HAMP domain-containing sensor histidine kinase [Candidatus Dormibacteraeota bacterium]